MVPVENPTHSMPLETPLLGPHISGNAEMAEYFGTVLPARFGDFGTEYRAVRRAVALVDTNFRAFFSLSAPDRHRYLNAILTSNVRDLKAGQGTVGLLLTPQGHILAEVETFARADSILASSHAMVRDRTFSTLDKFIIMDDVKLEDVTSSTGTLDLLGPRAAGLIAELARVDISAMPELAHVEAKLGSIPCRIIRRTCVGHAAATLVAPRARLAELWQDLERRVRAQGGAPAGMEALNSIRLEAGTPWFGQDYDDKNIPHEAGLEQSHISYEKGCYTGQEIVERVRSRGHANRRLTGLQFLAGKAPATGTKLLVPGNPPGSEVGHVTSAGFSPLLGRRIGLGYVRREHAAIGTRLDASSTETEVISLPVVDKKSPA
jgi:folate-binding protein YgfZ